MLRVAVLQSIMKPYLSPIYTYIYIYINIYINIKYFFDIYCYWKTTATLQRCNTVYVTFATWTKFIPDPTNPNVKKYIIPHGSHAHIWYEDQMRA